MKIQNLQNENRKFIKSIDNFHVLDGIYTGCQRFTVQRAE